ncbi:sigma-70 family RNA polymerase sigma factor [Luteimonas viscosa]|uniref:Sigma-70 family RNA polymerase sigma factor n=1 Tax=Luteimonas viscosa TaxID=1132694 RepID=A0A5D4XP79_9GAMM|nr:sigma-70 family RNA polymerase sigma factor [Luteimonas viscosa]TYT26389.1 sigma-70 family RNA polymerase sigma factor [Luteimonas viscosa]
MPKALDDWFIREILVHEAPLMHYLLRSAPRREEASDLRQEVYARVYEAAGKALPQQPKAFLFATARHLLADRARRAKVVSIEPVGDFEPLHVLVDDVSPERWCGGRQVLMRLADAFDRLPDRCREVVWLRRVEHLSQREVAQRLGISEKTVEKHIAKGMRLIAGSFYGGDDVPRPAARGRPPVDADGQQQAD